MIVIPKNRTEEVRVTLDEFRGMTLLNVRVWYRAEDGEMRPGKQGIALRPESALAVADAIRTLALTDDSGGG